MKVLLALSLAFVPSVADEGWSDEVVDLVARLPVQDEGRVKPLSTVASYALLRMHHSRSCETDDGRSLEPTEWLLDVLLFPERAVTYPVFRVESDEVIDAIGLRFDGRKERDLYSYAELAPGRERLFHLAHEGAQTDEKKRSPLEGQLVHLAESLNELERYLQAFDFARVRVEGRPFSQLIVNPDEDLRDDLLLLARGATGLRMLPPFEGDTWASAGDIGAETLLRGPPDERHFELLQRLEAVVAARERPAELERELRGFSELVRASAGSDVVAAVDDEVSFYALGPFDRALVLYLLGFVLVAVTWLRPQLRKVRAAAYAITGAAAALHVTGIVLRCLLRDRPPVSTLYETILFVGAVAVLACLAMEWVDRRRLAGSLAPTLGALALFLALRFEELQSTDTMPRLVAVLDTNFWLATHVTAITIGYSAGLLASAFAHVYLLGRAFGVKRDDDAGYRALARMVYGTLCFSLIFTVVGTILGGVWANDSWGRFWGWDPKENGALMIVLSQLAILHGRLGGFLRGFGICAATIVQGGVVAFSWWGVNLLGVGLHSYGFTAGIWNALLAFYALEALVLGLAFVRGRWRGPPAAIVP